MAEFDTYRLGADSVGRCFFLGVRFSWSAGTSRALQGKGVNVDGEL